MRRTKDHGRGTVDFYDIEYTRPDVDLAVGELEKTAEIIEKNAISYEEQLAKIKSLEVINSDISTAAAFANLMSRVKTLFLILKCQFKK